jgi:anti-sigma B factor antagonist
VSLLEVSVSAGPSGPVVTLAGEADLNNVAELRRVLSAQISGGARHLTVDLSRLRFADSTAIRALIVAGRSLERTGGQLVLLRPQSTVARIFQMLGLDETFTITTDPDTGERA